MGGGGGLPTAGRASHPGNLGWPGDSDGRGPLLAEADEPGLTLADAERPSSQPDNTGQGGLSLALTAKWARASAPWAPLSFRQC